MNHISTRAQLYSHVARTTHDVDVRDSINRGHTTLWGRFEGGWVLETCNWGWKQPKPTSTIVVGVKITGAVGQHLVSGRLSGVPWADYIGGESDLNKGDFPEVALENRAKQANTTWQSDQDKPDD